MPSKNDDLKSAILNLKETVEQALVLLAQGNEGEARELVQNGIAVSGFEMTQGVAAQGHGLHVTEPTKVPDGSRVTEGVFDGQHMIGADGKQYLVPPNYASKSKLVEGDMMKLSITQEGAFIYKQIGPIDRRRVNCKLEKDEMGMWHATAGVHRWRLLTAAVTYFKGNQGDEAIILVPSATPSKWAAVENIIAR